MNLISNTGIQYYTTSLMINMSDNFKMFFHEWFDTEEELEKIEIAHCFSSDDDNEIWVRKKELARLGYLVDGVLKENWETIKEDFFYGGYKTIPIQTVNAADSGCFHESVNRISWEKFENVWLPMPFFRVKENNKSDFGPTNWCRFKLIPTEIKGGIKKYSLLMAFDTRTIYEDDDYEEEDLNETPVFSSDFEKSKDFSLCNDEFKLVDYCGKPFKCDWVDAYVLKLYHNVRNINDLRINKPVLRYLAQYIFILRYIQKLNVLPKVTLFSNKNVAYGNVDLVVDIGNSRTCAVLCDNSDFTKTSPLELQDFSNPVLNGKLNKHKDSFDMRLAFREADFGGKFGIENSRQFIYPGMVRLGIEANKLIHQATNMNLGTEKVSTFSSPKRFLWDTKPQKKEWEFVKLAGEASKPIYIRGISEQLNADGSLNTDGRGSILMYYSRKTLMTLAFIEILAQAKMQINSYEQRFHWGNLETPRQIRRIIVTCPTAMSKVEQIALRKCAEDAAIILDRFYNNKYSVDIDENEARRKIQVIPSVRNISSKDDRKEWIYDEATCAQFVFLYAEIGKRYLKNVKEYFELYGKKRDDLENYTKKSLTIGSVDIGAGTTDVMIAAYKYDDSEQCILTPRPLFWESFYKAGDDLVKELIHQLVIEGQYSPIENSLITKGITINRVRELNNDFFGGNNGMPIRNRQLRSDFNLQISVPIVSKYLELLKKNVEENKILSFNDIFENNNPTDDLLNHFKNHFGFDFTELKWNYQRKLVAAIVEKTFDSLVGKISALFSFHACDIVLLSGRPTSLKPLTDLFLKYYAISPNRMKTMNDYRVGRWYPEDKRYKFLNGNGYFINPKSIVTTGAMIGNYASNGGLMGFSLNLTELINKLLPTTEYFGKLNERTLEFSEPLISPDINFATIVVETLPFKIGTRQYNSNSYPTRLFYSLDINLNFIENRVRERMDNEEDLTAVQDERDREISRIEREMPLRVDIERDYIEDKELLKITSVTSQKGDSLPTNYFSLQVQSMSEPENFWLETGIFEPKTNKS